MHRLAGATRHDEPNGWCQKIEGDVLNLKLLFTAIEREEMAGGEEEWRWRDVACGGTRAPVALRGHGCEHRVEPDHTKMKV